MLKSWIWRPWFYAWWSRVPAFAVLTFATHSIRAADEPFLITYSHQMEEPGNLEIETKSVTGKPGGGNRFLGASMELEYSLTRWWTTSMYLDGQATGGQSTIFTGYRWENRFRLLPHEHWINPVLYAEYENVDGADKTLLEVVGRDGKDDLIQPNQIARRGKAHELEARLILGSSFKGWTIAENLIGEKNLGHAPFEFGYTAGISRPLSLSSQHDHCNFCARSIQVGVEMYGGLGTANDFGFRATSHYVAPVVSWTLTSDTTFRVSPGFGVTNSSVPFLLRFGVSYGIDEFGSTVRSLFGGHRSGSETP